MRVCISGRKAEGGEGGGGAAAGSSHGLSCRQANTNKQRNVEKLVAGCKGMQWRRRMGEGVGSQREGSKSGSGSGSEVDVVVEVESEAEVGWTRRGETRRRQRPECDALSGAGGGGERGGGSGQEGMNGTKGGCLSVCQSVRQSARQSVSSVCPFAPRKMGWKRHERATARVTCWISGLGKRSADGGDIQLHLLAGVIGARQR